MRQHRFVCIAQLFVYAVATGALSAVSRKGLASLASDLQKCLQPADVLQRVGRHVTSGDPNGSLASLVLVRLSKLCISLDNSHENNHELWIPGHWSEKENGILSLVVDSLTSSSANTDALVEGTKAFSVLSRLIPDLDKAQRQAMIDFWHRRAVDFVSDMEPHHHSGLYWAFQTLAHTGAAAEYPEKLQDAYSELDLPFTVIPGCLESIPNLSISRLSETVQFAVDEIVTNSNRRVPERRQTAWQGDTSVGPFLYSGKSMERQDWSPVVKNVRDHLHEEVGTAYYDCCLLNLYPDGGSGMRYHVDPDQGDLWDYDTAVVSVGATRRFAFREGSHGGQPHSFWVFHGDVTHMVRDCQQRFQHTVKKAENRNEDATRISLVFKRTWNH